MLGKAIASALALLILVAGSPCALAGMATGKDITRVVFSRGSGIWLTDLSGSKPIFLTKGVDPEISPDGSRVAFTAYDANGGRRIAVFDIASRKTRILKEIPGDNSYGPRWSPDGQRLLFNHWLTMEAKWVIAAIVATGENMHILTRKLSGAYSPFWSADGLSGYAQDLAFLYNFDFEGNILSKRALKEIVGERGVSSATRFAISPDGKRWLLDADVDEHGDEWGRTLEGPVSAVLLYLPEKGSISRLSPPGMSATGGCWAKSGDILFWGFTGKDVKQKDVGLDIAFSIYRTDENGGVPRILVKNGIGPSCATR